MITIKIIAALDSFKGSFTSIAGNQVIQDIFLKDEVTMYPIADGGEGTIDAFCYLKNGEMLKKEICGPAGEKIIGRSCWLASEKTFVLEVAEGAGITKVPTKTLNPTHHTSYGVGEQIKQGLALGAEKIIIGLGGSATVDGGFGMLQALGVCFYNHRNKKMPRLPIQLDQVEKIDLSQLEPRLAEVEIIVAYDVENPLLGSQGAVQVFGLQKGLRENQLGIYERGLAQYAEKIKNATGTDLVRQSGSGAAGGLGFACFSVLDAKGIAGIELMSNIGQLETLIAQADLVITGEGKFDRQSLNGKVPVGISRLASKYQVPVWLFTAVQEDNGVVDLLEENITAIIPIIDKVTDQETALSEGLTFLTRAVRRTKHLVSLSCGKSIF